MTREIINIGTNANDGTGDDLRLAMQKVNSNFQELYATNELEEDTSPKLAGNLDVQTHSIITTATNGDIVLTPNGTGAVKADAISISGTTISSDDSSLITLNEDVNITGTLTVDGAVTSTGNFTASNLITNNISSDDSTAVQINDGLNISGTLGVNNIDTNFISSSDSTHIQFGNGINVAGRVSADTLDVNTIYSGDSTAVVIDDGLIVNGTTRISGFTFPTTDGISGQVLQTNGNGELSFVSLGGGSGGATLTFVGDDSTGTVLNNSRTFTFAGGTNISTSVLGDTLTITGPNLTNYLNSTDVTVSGNTISTTQSNSNLELSANGTGSVNVNSKLTVTDIETADSSAVNINAPLRVDTLGDEQNVMYVGSDKNIASSNLLKVDVANNRIGIGHLNSSPEVRLDIVGSGASNTAQIRMTQSFSDTDGPNIGLRKTRGTYNSPEIVQAGDDLGKLHSLGYVTGPDGSTTTYLETGQLYWTATSSEGDSRFRIDTGSAGSLVNRFEIADTGAITFNQAYTFPSTDGTGNQVLVTDGSGTLAFADISSVFTPSIKFGDTTSSTIEITNGNVLNLKGAGGITATVAGDTLTIDGTGVVASTDIGLLKVDGTTITPAASNGNIQLNSNGTGQLNFLSGGDITLNPVNGVFKLFEGWATAYTDVNTQSRYNFGLSSFDSLVFDLSTNTQRMNTNSIGARVTLSGTDPGNVSEIQWKGLRSELITDVAGGSVTSTTSGLMTGGGGALQAAKLFRNSTASASTLTESTTASAISRFLHTSAQGSITITDYSDMVTNIDLGIEDGTTTITNHYGFITAGSRKSNASATATITNEYSFYAKDQTIATNPYGVYIENTNWKNYLGGVELHSGSVKTIDSNLDLTLSANGSGVIKLADSVEINGAYTLPTADGDAGQFVTTDGSGNLSFATVISEITFVGDDSTGTTVNTGETFKIAGGTNITTAVSGDTLTITGPDLSSYATQAYVDARDIGDLSISGSTISSPSNANLTLNSSNGSVVIEGITVEGSTISSTDSSQILINDGVRITGELTAPSLVTNTITSSDSTEVVINDGVRVTGTLTAGTIVASTISPPDSISGSYTITSPTTITLSPTEETLNTAPMTLYSRTVSQLSSLTATTGAMVFCTDESGGSVPAFFDGTNWRRVTDRAVVS
jgi:hypothetical protein